MGTIASLLDEILGEHDRIGSPLRGYLLDPTPGTDVQAEVDRLGLIAPPAVLELHGWHGGMDNDRWRRDGHGGHLSLFDNTGHGTIAETVRDSAGMREVAADLAESWVGSDAVAPSAVGAGVEGGALLWQPTWISLLESEGLHYAIECAGDDSGAIWRFYTHPNRYLTRRSFDSLDDLLRLVLGNFRAGAYWWDPELEILLTEPGFED
jgi:hypothetical protein